MKQYNVTGMGCAACSARVEKAVSEVAGVESCQVNLLTNSMQVSGAASDEAIIKAVVDAGYGASVQDTAESDDSDDEDSSDRETQALRKRLLLSLGFLIVLIIVSKIGNTMFARMAEMLLSLAVLIINREFFISGFKGVLHRASNMDTLVAMGSSASFLWSIYALFANEDLYFESAAMILVLITVGKLLEAKSKGRTTDAIKSISKLAPKTAIVIRGGIEQEINISEIKVGDIFSVKAGKSIPVDGVVIEGEATIDESALTGESLPVDKTEGSIVSAATINQNGIIKCKATRVGEDTTLSQIIRMVSDAAASKAPISKIADKVSAVFVPMVIGIALVTFVIWLLNGSAFDFALARSISVLVISCPCSLGLATPVAIMVGSGVGAKKGILFKSATSLEETGKVKTVVLDKTGTITEGEVGHDVIRSDSREAIGKLKAMGLKVVMLSGDKIETAKSIAQKAGIENVIAGVLPGGKEEVVANLMSESKVAMVGDGINDAVALTSANVGIAIGAGTDVAIDAADVVLMNSKLSDVVTAIRLSRATLKNIKENLFWAFFYNVLCIPLAAGCYTGLLGITLNPMIAAAAMSLSSICVVLNALRLNLFK